MRGRVGVVDDPVWSEPPPPLPPATDRTVSRVRATRIFLRVSMYGSLGLAASTLLPWYGFAQAGVPRWSTSPVFIALSGYLARPGWHDFLPGAQGWGFLVLGVSCAVAILVWFVRAAVLRGRESGASHARRWVLAVAVTTTLLPVLSVLGLFARPPAGPATPLWSDWGAVVGVAASIVAVIGGCSSTLVLVSTLT
jgi:hypothetical protein